MNVNKTIVFGAGKRVREAALPALEAHDGFVIKKLYARSDRTLDLNGKSYEIRDTVKIAQADLDDVDLISIAVTKDAVPRVLTRLTELDVRHCDLLIDTPVVRFRHFAHAEKLDAFRNAWVAEDCTELPWFDTVRAAMRADLIGELQEVRFHRSAYAYHGVATSKALLECDRVISGKRVAIGDGLFERRLKFANGKRATIVEPRDYSSGHIELIGTKGKIADRDMDGAHRLEPILDGDAVTGFRIGDVTTKLWPEESALTLGDAREASVIARMESMKRVGFLRLLEGIAAGRGSYPAHAGLDDMVVDYHLEKLKRYRSNPFTSAGSPLARRLLGLLSRLGG